MDREQDVPMQTGEEAGHKLARVEAGAPMAFAEWLEWIWIESDRNGGAQGSVRHPPAELPRPGPHVTIACLTHLFRYAEPALAAYDEDEVAAILHLLVNEAEGDAIRTLRDPGIPEADRIACAEAMGDFLTGCMAARCAPVANCWNTKADRLLPRSGLNMPCFMWWDSLAVHARPDSPQARAVDEALLAGMVRQLASPNIAVQESGLHGLGHWSHDYPAIAVPAIDAFLAASPQADPRLLAYARQARTGCIP